jgi:methionyl aminopeptidase
MTADTKDDVASCSRRRIVRETFERMKAAAVPASRQRNSMRSPRAVFAARGARSAPQAMYDFPGATCISVNEQAAHGIPGPRRLAGR